MAWRGLRACKLLESSCCASLRCACSPAERTRMESLKKRAATSAELRAVGGGGGTRERAGEIYHKHSPKRRRLWQDRSPMQWTNTAWVHWVMWVVRGSEFTAAPWHPQGSVALRSSNHHVLPRHERMTTLIQIWHLRLRPIIL